MAAPAIDLRPGYRRRFRITPGPGRVLAELEDDLHCMAVALRHQDGIVTAVEPEQDRAPWTTCPGAKAQLVQTFAGLSLAAFAGRGAKTANCTHLHDLALLAAAHASDAEPLVYDVLASDPIDGRRELELRRNGVAVLHWTEEGGAFVEPAELRGLNLQTMGRYIASLPAEAVEAARVLRWGALVAISRTIPFDAQSNAAVMPPNCYTFQPEQKPQARRVGEMREFSTGKAEPLDRRPNPQGA